MQLHDQAQATLNRSTYCAGCPKFVCQAHRAAAADSQVSNGCVSGGTIPRSVLFSNTRIAARGVVEDSVLLPEVEVGRHAQLRCKAASFRPASESLQGR